MGTVDTTDSTALLMDSSSTSQYKLGRKEGVLPDLGYGERATLVLLPPSDRTDLSPRALTVIIYSQNCYLLIIYVYINTIAAFVTLYGCPQRELVTKSWFELGSGRRVFQGWSPLPAKAR